jgi:hypothetical protein
MKKTHILFSRFGCSTQPVLKIVSGKREKGREKGKENKRGRKMTTQKQTTANATEQANKTNTNTKRKKKQKKREQTRSLCWEGRFPAITTSVAILCFHCRCWGSK